MKMMKRPSIDRRKLKIEPAPTDQVKEVADEIRRLLVFIGDLEDPGAGEEWVGNCSVSDLSNVGYFMLTPGGEAALGQSSGFRSTGEIVLSRWRRR